MFAESELERARVHIKGTVQERDRYHLIAAEAKAAAVRARKALGEAYLAAHAQRAGPEISPGRASLRRTCAR